MDDLFLKIVDGTIPSKKVLETDNVLAFHDIQPAAPVHVLIIPKKYIPSMNAVTEEDLPLIAEIHRVAVEVAKKLGIAESGYRLINNCGPDSGQAVGHLHYHLLGGAKLGALTGISDSHS
ncbi:histidine triad nucleotide-binding protein [Paenibacillus sp. SEL3]|jgi:histidine triad (HIT) family protein|uniref:Histidine triad nucleotide-binding protein n=2 Tax=Paenibacillus TaxID=44249 RepID=A0A074LF31_PAEPO|nr:MULTISPECIES: histidine triad nucleotide-binding protein [Paenibacillus]KAF6636348.1 histidine triad nucleotide-binding protein [Paenibacillus sp. EKM208P]MCF2719718.1 histidine triad nucleotide-binding protein [Paenibacillus sp. UKAQ_18]AOK89087.1 histidine triad nucleotide-binding protein [Paenibacillus polymyxa]APB70430.1 Holliday junction branch migration protein RuvA [Paenibacillus polymyxa]APB75098.1 Holliday junction branch migration protein RuvA [Paenibacillus polymyxa]